MVALMTAVLLTIVLDAFRRGVVVDYGGPLRRADSPVMFWLMVATWSAMALFHIWMVLTFPAR